MKKKVLCFTFFSLFLTAVLCGCSVNTSNGRTVRGTGRLVEYTLDVAGFTGIETGGAYILTFRQAPTFSVTLEIQKNLFRHVEAEVRGGILYVDSNRPFNTTSGNTPRLVVSAPDLNSLAIAGAVSANIELETDRLHVNVTGAASLTLTGTANRMDISSAGAANVNAFEMITNHVTINTAGAGNIDVYASETLDVTITGAGRVRYDGDPQLTRSILGVGMVTKR
jgi:hypothetical protein